MYNRIEFIIVAQELEDTKENLYDLIDKKILEIIGRKYDLDLLEVTIESKEFIIKGSTNDVNVIAGLNIEVNEAATKELLGTIERLEVGL
jgi:hypothetical protein